MDYITATFELHVEGDDPLAFHSATVELPANPWPAQLAHELKRRSSPNDVASGLTAALALVSEDIDTPPSEGA